MAIDKKIKVLIVDDFSTMRRICKHLLKQIGFTNIVEADDGTTALNVLRKEPVDLVLTDWNMPKMNGLELLKAIRKDPNLKHLPVIMVTAEALNENIIAALKAGVNNYIVKPFNAQTLEKKIEDVIGKK
jgi:two-component system chemotaxis response regulator CheY